MNQYFRKYVLFLCLVGITTFAMFCGSFLLEVFASEEADDYDSIIVRPKETLQKNRRLSWLMERRGILRYQKINDKVYVVPVEEGDDKDLKISELKETGLFDLVEPDYKLSLSEVETERNYVKINIRNDENNSLENINTEVKEITPNDEDFLSQYYLKKINAPKAWGTTVGDELLVGVLDTGVDAAHPDLAGKVFEPEDSLDVDVTDEIGHGTGVAGIIAANTNNNKGIAGIAWNTKIVPVRVTDSNGQAKVSSVISALERAHNNGVKIIQISLSTGQFSQSLKDAVKEAIDRNILIISTGGNTGVRELRYPSAFEGVVGVGAVNDSEQLEVYSTTGDHISIVAPGSFIHTTSLSSGYAAVSGTSFAAPQVAGTAALVWSLVPDLTNYEVREILTESAKDLGEEGKDHVYGYGLLDTQKAVELAKLKQLELGRQNESNKEEIEKIWTTK